MPGLCAIARPSASDIGGTIDTMLGHLLHYPWLGAVRQVSAEPGVALGAAAHATRANLALARSGDGRFTVVLDGEFFDDTGAAHADEFLDGWQRDGRRFLAGLNGEFGAVVWDAARRELLVISDRFGLRCLYVAETPDAFLVSSEIKALLAVPGVDMKWSETGVAEFFAFGHFYNDDTLLRGVRALPAATCGTYRLDDRTYTETPYWSLGPRAAPGSVAEITTAIEDRFVQAVERRARPGERLGLSLSGGLDARTILGVMPRGIDLQTVSIGIEGSLDHRSASELASIAGVPHREYLLNGGFLAGFEQHLREMVRLTDGHYLDQGIVMPSMRLYRELGIDYLLRGHGGELLHMRKAYAFSLDDEVLGATAQEVERWLWSHLTGYMLDGVPDDLFTIDVRALAREALQRAIARCPETTRPVDRIWHLFLNERIHRETALSMHKFGCFAGVRQPYLDAPFVELLFSLRAEHKLGDDVQTNILRRRQPAFLQVTNSNTGARLGAGPLETSLATLRLKVGAKLGLKGYQPYERLGLWLRRELRGLVEGVLSQEAFLDSGVVRADVVTRLVREHAANEGNHTFLLMSLLIFALGIEARAAAGRQAPAAEHVGST